MAYKEITVDPESVGSGGEFLNLKVIGDKVSGVFTGTTRPSTSKFAKPGQLIFEILVATEIKGKFKFAQFDPPTHGQMSLNAALKDGRLVAGCKVLATFDGEKNVGQESKMKLVKVLIDSDSIPSMLVLITKTRGEAPVERQQTGAAVDPFGARDGDDIPF